MIAQRPTAAILTDAPLVAEMLDLIAPSYVDARPLVERELRINTTGYLFYGNDTRLKAFFLVGHGFPGRVGGELAVFLGLSACREEDKSRGLPLRLYRRFITDGLAWQIDHGERLRLWATTAHPLIWSICRRFWDVELPREDGTFSPEAAELAWELRRQLPERYQHGEHPFICRQSATSTLYSDQQIKRCEAARHKLIHDIFGQFRIDERKGDRLLMLARLRPEDERGRQR
jgi:hypothetical protein